MVDLSYSVCRPSRGQVDSSVLAVSHVVSIMSGTAHVSQVTTRILSPDRIFQGLRDLPEAGQGPNLVRNVPSLSNLDLLS